jgi:hypothetical protein
MMCAYFSYTDMKLFIKALILFLLATSLPVMGQHPVDSKRLYERVFVAVPLIGRGTWSDPIRPMLAPAPSQVKLGDRSGLLAFHFEASDNGKTAIVEWVFANRTAMAPTLSSFAALPLFRMFQAGKDSRDDIETQFKALKKSFDLDKFMARMP